MYAVIKKHSLCLKTVATRIARADATSFCCHMSLIFSSCLELRSDMWVLLIELRLYLTNTHIFWEHVGIVRPGLLPCERMNDESSKQPSLVMWHNWNIYHIWELQYCVFVLKYDCLSFISITHRKLQCSGSWTFNTFVIYF